MELGPIEVGGSFAVDSDRIPPEDVNPAPGAALLGYRGGSLFPRLLPKPPGAQGLGAKPPGVAQVASPRFPG